MTNTTAIQSLVSNLVQGGPNALFDYASTSPASILKDITGKTSTEIISELTEAGVNSSTLSEISSNISLANVTSLLSSLFQKYSLYDSNVNRGNSTIAGGSNNDLIINDTLTGGGGADTFELTANFNLFNWSTSGSDVIKDFNASEGDKIKINTNLPLSNLLTFNSSTSQLYFGTKVVATLEGITSFNTSNVQLV